MAPSQEKATVRDDGVRAHAHINKRCLQLQNLGLASVHAQSPRQNRVLRRAWTENRLTGSLLAPERELRCRLAFDNVNVKTRTTTKVVLTKRSQCVQDCWSQRPAWHRVVLRGIVSAQGYIGRNEPDRSPLRACVCMSHRPNRHHHHRRWCAAVRFANPPRFCCFARPSKQWP
jgi:hypothetical protein